MAGRDLVSSVELWDLEIRRSHIRALPSIAKAMRGENTLVEKSASALSRVRAGDDERREDGQARARGKGADSGEACSKEVAMNGGSFFEDEVGEKERIPEEDDDGEVACDSELVKTDGNIGMPADAVRTLKQYKSVLQVFCDDEVADRVVRSRWPLREGEVANGDVRDRKSVV